MQNVFLRVIKFTRYLSLILYNDDLSGENGITKPPAELALVFILTLRDQI